MKSWQYRKFVHSGLGGARLFIQEGKLKDQYCKFRYAGGPKFSVELESVAPGASSGEVVEVHYTNLEELDEYGAVKIFPVMDMTGREITEDAYICYSVSAGRSSHALEIGKVVEMTKSGGLKVRRVVHNGDKVDMNHWRGNVVNVTDPFRSIRLPVDVTTMTMWIMQEFDAMAKQVS